MPRMREKDTAYDQEYVTGEDLPGTAMRLIGPIHLRTAKAVCWHCEQVTSVHAFIASDIVDMGAQVKAPCYVYGITSPPRLLMLTAAEHAPRLRLALHRGKRSNYLSNHCEHCDAQQPDFRLYTEPDGPFAGAPPSGHFGPVVIMDDVPLEFAEYSY